MVGEFRLGYRHATMFAEPAGGSRGGAGRQLGGSLAYPRPALAASALGVSSAAAMTYPAETGFSSSSGGIRGRLLIVGAICAALGATLDIAAAVLVPPVA